MKSNLKDILEAIPDFEDFMKLADKISELSLNKMRVENKIKTLESQMFIKAVNEFLINGKPPSAAHIERAYLHTGMNGEILAEREALATISSELEKKKIQLAIYRDMLEVFRTVSANERAVSQ